MKPKMTSVLDYLEECLEAVTSCGPLRVATEDRIWFKHFNEVGAYAAWEQARWYQQMCKFYGLKSFCDDLPAADIQLRIDIVKKTLQSDD
jgi:hypothetical protein